MVRTEGFGTEAAHVPEISVNWAPGEVESECLHGRRGPRLSDGSEFYAT